MRTSGRLISIVMLSLAACSSDDPTDADGDGISDGVLDPNNVTVVAPTRPQGFIAGEVWDATADRPLDGVRVRVVGGGVAADPVTTGAEGEFGFGPISAGAAFALHADKADFSTASIPNLTIDDAAGNFPTINGAIFVGPIGLLPTTGTFDVQVVGSDGAPVPGAEVTIETSLAFLLGETAVGSAHAVGMTDPDGRATIEGLPNVRRLPPRFENAAALVVHIAPVDLDGDGLPDLDGRTVAVSGRDVRTQALPLLIVLDPPGDGMLRVVASNVSGLAGGPVAPAVLPDGEPIRVVFSGPIDRESLLVDLRDEDGSTEIVNSFVVSALGNVLTITAADTLGRGLEFNVAIQAQSRDRFPVQIVDVAAPFFVEETRGEPIQVQGTFHDRNGDGLWGTGTDELILNVSNPVGRAGAGTAFALELWVALDLNGTSTVGDAAGELPATGDARPAPIVINAAEPAPGNGSPVSGFTRFVTPRRINLPNPLSQAAGAVDFEVRFTPERNGGDFITSPGGRAAPAIETGTAPLISGG